jgi:hypothetical protein
VGNHKCNQVIHSDRRTLGSVINILSTYLRSEGFVF